MDNMWTCATKDYSCKMHACLRQAMRLCRWAGVFPVEGLEKETPSGLRFNTKSPYIFFHCITLMGQVMLAAMAAYHFFVYNLSLTHLISLTLFTTNMTTAFFIAKLATNWPTLIQRASHLEKRVARIVRPGSINPGNYTRIAYTMLVLSLTEHVLSVIYKMKQMMSCREDDTMSLDFLRDFFVTTVSFIFKVISYSHWKAVLYEVINLQSIFLWNITDSMTICVSLYLTSYFRDLNKFIEHQQRQKTIRWELIRLYYSDLVQLVQTVDSKMCYLILLSFFSNVFFICVQVFSLFNMKHPSVPGCHPEIIKNTAKSPVYYIYYCYSSLFLFTRATVTSLLAANVNSVASKPLRALQQVSSEEYSIEVQRFIRQTTYTITALSGLFFDLTRAMILTVIATIVKYELVLLQFSVKTYEAIQ